MTTIAIIGTGRMSTGLATGWVKAGHRVMLGSRHPEKGSPVEGAALVSPDEALNTAEVVVLAVPFREVERFARDHAAMLRDKPVIDITNAFDALPDYRVAGAELTAAAIGSDVHVIAAFKNNFWHTLTEPVDANGLTRDIHFAGGTETDKQTLAGLIRDLGFAPVDCGPLKNARILEGLTRLIIDLDGRYGGSQRSFWKFVAG